MFFLLVPLAAAAPPTSEQQSAMTGVFALAESLEAITPRLEEALVRTVESLSLVFRPIAKVKLRPEVTVCPVYYTSLTSLAFGFHCDTEHDFLVPLVGGKTTWDGSDAYQATVRVMTGSVKVSVMGEDGGKVSTFRLVGTDQMQVTHSIVSQHLAEPLSWTVLYARYT